LLIVPTHGYQLGAAGNLSRQIIHVEGAIVVVYFGHANRDATFLESYPGGVVGGVIEASDYDLISWIQFAADRPADGKGQRGHICAEDDFLRITGKKISHGDPGAEKHRVGPLASGKEAVCVGIAGAQVIRDRVDDALRNLGSAWSVEEHRGVPMDGLREGGKLSADPVRIECAGGVAGVSNGDVF
jgi:hypothetical protein